MKKRKVLKKWALYFIFTALLGGFITLLYGLNLVASDGINLYFNNDIINFIIFTAFISLIKKNVKAIIKREK